MNITAQQVHQRQLAYVNSVEPEGLAADMIAGEAFVLSMRKLGYKSAATAANEIIDNALEAGAANIHVVFGSDTKGSGKPDHIAFIDDGYGMVPRMVSVAARWGGTDRHDSRTMFGRFGFGLPSASVSQGRAFQVFSRIDDGDYYAVTIDVDDIVAGKYSKNGQVLAPKSKALPLPGWVETYLSENFPGGVAGARTVIIWSKFDNLTWKTNAGLETAFLQRFGVTYRGFLRTTTMFVNGKRVDPIDPLFTTEGMRYYEPLPKGAEPYENTYVDIKNEETGVVSTVTVRYAYQPRGFLDGAGKGKPGKVVSPARARFMIRRENNGLIICRNGRQIDVVSRDIPDFTFQNNTRYAAVEVDFPAELDEEFGITTSKQQVTLSTRIIDALERNNVFRTVKAMEKRYEEEKDQQIVRDLDPEDDKPRASEVVMEELQNVVPSKPRTPQQEEKSESNLQREVEEAAEQTGLPRDIVEQQKRTEARQRPYRIEFSRVPEGPFYRPELRGGQLVISLNQDHKFYTQLYGQVQGPEGAKVRASLEVLLFILGQCEVEGSEESAIWYQSERVEWGRRLTAAMKLLETKADISRPDADDETGLDVTGDGAGE